MMKLEDETLFRWATFNKIDDKQNPFRPLIQQLYYHHLSPPTLFSDRSCAHIEAIRQTLERLMLLWFYRMGQEADLRGPESTIIKALDAPDAMNQYKLAVIAFAQRETFAAWRRMSKLERKMNEKTILPLIQGILLIDYGLMLITVVTHMVHVSPVPMILGTVIANLVILYAATFYEHVVNPELMDYQKQYALWAELDDRNDYNNKIGFKSCLIAFRRTQGVSSTSEDLPVDAVMKADPGIEPFQIIKKEDLWLAEAGLLGEQQPEKKKVLLPKMVSV